MRTGQSSGVQQILEMVGTEKGILGVRIFDEKGTILKSFDRTEIGKSVDPGVLKHFKDADRDFLDRKGRTADNAHTASLSQIPRPASDVMGGKRR